MSQKPLVTCAYGWGRVFKLYRDFVDVNGTLYTLSDLVQTRKTYRRVLNIPSMRLELRFKEEDVVLRGIAAIDDAKKIVKYLDTYCADASPLARRSHTRQNRQLERASASFGTVREAHVDAFLSNAQVTSVFSNDRNMQELAQAITTPVETPRWLRDLDKDIQHTRERQHSQALRSQNRYGFEVEKLAGALQAGTLPSVAVPLRLLDAERAHYSTGATLCDEPLSDSTRDIYPAKDHGTLILTNKRLVYIGRKSQLMLDYTHLTHISRLRGAIACSSDHWSRREIFEMGHSLECAMYLDRILQQFHRQWAKREPQRPQKSMQTPSIHPTSTGRTTHHRQAMRTWHTSGTRPIKPASTVTDVDTLPLSATSHAEIEMAEES